MTAAEQWQQGNEDYLAAALEWLRLRLRHYAEHGAPVVVQEGELRPGVFARLWRHLFGFVPASPRRKPFRPVTEKELAAAAKRMDEAAAKKPAPALMELAKRFGLSPFERSVLLLCAGMELDTRVAGLCASAQDSQRPYPTLALAMALFDEPAWDVRSPKRPLFHWRLVEADTSAALPLNSARLHANPHIVNFIKGLDNYLDDRLIPYLALMGRPSTVLPPSQERTANAVLAGLRSAMTQSAAPVMQLIGPDGAGKRIVAETVSHTLGLNLYRLPAELIPTILVDLESLARLCQREPQLRPMALYVDAHDADRGGGPEAPLQQVQRFLERTPLCCLFLDVREPLTTTRSSVNCAVDKPTPTEQLNAWCAVLGPEGEYHAGQLTGQFAFNFDVIEDVGRAVADFPENERGPRAWSACLNLSRRGFDGLAQLSEPRARWEDLVLPEAQRGLLSRIIGQVRRRMCVYDKWGFRAALSRGLGISVLFHGESGTGKTMAAEIIAGELGLHLCTIDLSSVVSKYIGETEKNLRRVFDAAEQGGCVLCFNEADALFGRRSEVRDSHDRYANIEINYLLQRMECYSGLAILTTNMKSALDPAFVRRLRFIVPFGFPSQAERALIWRKAVPGGVPISKAGLDFDWLARTPLTGAAIKNIALAGSFLAAENEQKLAMDHLLAALRTELTKLEQPIRESDLNWTPREVRAG